MLPPILVLGQNLLCGPLFYVLKGVVTPIMQIAGNPNIIYTIPILSLCKTDTDWTIHTPHKDYGFKWF